MHSEDYMHTQKIDRLFSYIDNKDKKSFLEVWNKNDKNDNESLMILLTNDCGYEDFILELSRENEAFRECMFKRSLINDDEEIMWMLLDLNYVDTVIESLRTSMRYKCLFKFIKEGILDPKETLKRDINTDKPLDCPETREEFYYKIITNYELYKDATEEEIELWKEKCDKFKEFISK